MVMTFFHASEVSWYYRGIFQMQLIIIYAVYDEILVSQRFSVAEIFFNCTRVFVSCKVQCNRSYITITVSLTMSLIFHYL